MVLFFRCLFVALFSTVFISGRSVIASDSTCGMEWKPSRTQPSSYHLGVAYGNGQFVVVGADKLHILTSSDGEEWIARDTGASTSWGFSFVDVIWNGSLFTSVTSAGSGHPFIYSSTDGTNWDDVFSDYRQEDLYGVVWSGSQFVVVGKDGYIVTSYNGVAWSKQTSGTTASLMGIAWSGDQFVTVGDNGTILTSPDGIYWTKLESGSLYPLLRVVWSGSQFIAVGVYGTILTSPDGITWTHQNSGTNAVLDGITVAGKYVVVVGGNGTILTSLDGVNWIQQVSGTNVLLTSVTWTGTQLAAVGGNTFITSQCGEATETLASDLKVIRIKLIPATPAPDVPFKVKVTVKNIGNIAENAGKLRLWANRTSGIPICSIRGNREKDIGVLTPGEIKTVTFKLKENTPGLKSIFAFIDGDCTTDESREDNNLMVKPYSVK